MVIQADTNEPIQNVEIRERHGDGTYAGRTIVTGKDGAFTFEDISGGLSCPDVQLHFARPGYVPVDLTFPAGTHGDTIHLMIAR